MTTIPNDPITDRPKGPIRANPVARVMRFAAARGGRRLGAKVAVIGVLGVLVVGLGIIWSLLGNRTAPPISESPANTLDPRVAEALRLLDAGEIDQARRLATELRMTDMTFEELGGPVYVLGAAIIHDADEHWNPAEQRKLYVIGSRYMEEARDRSFPSGREGQGEYLLGRSLILGGRVADAVPALKAALASNPTRATTLHRHLAQAYLSDLPSQPKQALPHLEKYLSDRLLSSADRLEGLVLRAQIAFQLDDTPACRQALGEISQWEAEQKGQSGLPTRRTSGNRRDKSESRRASLAVRDAFILDAKLSLREAKQLDSNATDSNPADSKVPDVGAGDGSAGDRRLAVLGHARDVLSQLASQGRDTPESEYLLGVVLRELADWTAAREQFSRTARRSFGSPEGFASQVELAEIDSRNGDGQSTLESLLLLLEEADDGAVHTNRWMPIEKMRDRVLVLLANFMDERDFERASQVALGLHPLFPKEQATQSIASVYAKWALDLERQAETAPYSQGMKLRAQSRQRYLQAGQAYEELAKLRFATKTYGDDLWQSAESYLSANAHRKGAEMIRQYLRAETRRRRPRGLILLGEAMLALGEVDAAGHYFEQCVAAYPNDPDSYRGRVGAARAALERGRLDEAEKFLTENIENESLAPKSAEWRDSLFLIGEILHRKGVEQLTRSRESRSNPSPDEKARRDTERDLEQAFAALRDAVSRLTEAIERYPEDPRSVHARYLIADSHRHRSQLPRWKLPFETIESRRMELARRMRADLDAAREQYDRLATDLDLKADSTELSPIERAVQRNAYFARAHALFDLERYKEALDAYSTATSRYQNEPVSLEAYEQIAACYRKLGDSGKARGTREQAKVVIASMPTAVDYSRTTRYTRDQWLELLK